MAVVVPVHDGASFVGGAVASALDQRRGLSELGADLELIIVDDASTDGSGEVALDRAAQLGASDAVRLTRLDPMPGVGPHGPAAARNAGVAATSAGVLAFLDADDRWTSDALAHRFEILSGVPGPAMTAGRFILVDGPFVDEDVDEIPADAEPPDWWTFSLAASLMRRAVWDLVGPLDESMSLGEDLDWYLRARRAEVTIIDDPVPTLLYRQRPGSVSWGRRRDGAFRAIRADLARRRGS